MKNEIIVLLMVLSANAAAGDDKFYFISNGNKINSEAFKIIMSDNITSEVLMDNYSLYFYTDKNIYSVNNSNGVINFKLNFGYADSISQSDNFIYAKNKLYIIKIDKNTGNIVSKIISYEVNKILSAYAPNSNSVGTTDHAALDHLTWSTAGHTFDTFLDMNTHYITNVSDIYMTGADIGNANILGVNNAYISIIQHNDDYPYTYIEGADFDGSDIVNVNSLYAVTIIPQSISNSDAIDINSDSELSFSAEGNTKMAIYPGGIQFPHISPHRTLSIAAGGDLIGISGVTQNIVVMTSLTTSKTLHFTEGILTSVT